MNPKPQISKDTQAQDLRTLLDGRMEPEKIEAAVTSLTTTATSYPATGSIVSLVFYLKFQVEIKSPKHTFNGEAFGASTPGAGALFGDLYTDDLNRLTRNTVAFGYVNTPVYLSMYFFDSNDNLLGHVQFGAVSTVVGAGGGKGKWS